MVRFANRPGSDTHHLHRQWKSHQNRAHAEVQDPSWPHSYCIVFHEFTEDPAEALELRAGDRVRNRPPGHWAVPEETGIESGRMVG